MEKKVNSNEGIDFMRLINNLSEYESHSNIYQKKANLNKISNKYLFFTNKLTFTASALNIIEGKFPEQVIKYISGKLPNTEHTQLLKGRNGKVILIKNVFGYGNVILKQSHNLPKDPKTGFPQRIGVDFKQEAEILKALPEDLKNTTKYIARAVKGKVNYLLMTYVDGKTINPHNCSFEKDDFQPLLSDLAKLDRANLLHRDLKGANLLKETNGKINIIDYGVGIKFDPFNFDNNPYSQDLCPEWLPTNLRKFEEMGLGIYFKDLIKQKPLKGKKEADMLFLHYLSARTNFHREKYEFLKSLNITKESDKTKINRAIQFENVQANIFEQIEPNNPNDRLTKDVLELEKTRTNIGYYQVWSEYFDANDVPKNPIFALYYRCLTGLEARKLANKVKKISNTYKNDKNMKEFLYFQKIYANHKIKTNFIKQADNLFKDMSLSISSNHNPKLLNWMIEDSDKVFYG